MTVGIDALDFDVPKIHLNIAELAKARDIDPVKLEKGLGLMKMTIPDNHQDPVVFAANALKKLVEKNDLDPSEIHRLYVATESGVDGSKPIASFLVQIMEENDGAGSWSHCDVVDMTFACITGVDAMENCLDYIRLNPDKKAIVICTDIAKYDLASPGEYTQGAGAIAMLLSSEPRIITINKKIGVSTQGVFDFFKPRRHVLKSADHIDQWKTLLPDHLEQSIEIHQDQPVFNGQFSNTCYTDRSTDSYFALKKQLQQSSPLTDRWEGLIMHLPYSFQARRMFVHIFIQEQEELKKGLAIAEDKKAYIKSISKSPEYKKFVDQYLEPAERASSLIGNLYTGSIFMGLLSTLSSYLEDDKNNSDKSLGFIAYGSGSKSKAFEGTLQDGWKQAFSSTKLFNTLDKSTPIDYEQYVALHTGHQENSCVKPSKEYILQHIESEDPYLIGARSYKWVE